MSAYVFEATFTFKCQVLSCIHSCSGSGEPTILMMMIIIIKIKIKNDIPISNNEAGVGIRVQTAKGQ
jgi:hypothetical protein